MEKTKAFITLREETLKKKIKRAQDRYDRLEDKRYLKDIGNWEDQLSLLNFVKITMNQDLEEGKK